MKSLDNEDREMRPEYDFSGAQRGRHAEAYAAGTNVVLLDPDVAARFSDSAQVNNALRQVISKSGARVKEKRVKDEFFIEQRDEGNYAIRKPNSDRASAVEPTQAAAIARARRMNPDATIHVERVRNTEKGSRDKWRKL
ncbi:MAG: DUF2188 domain-containing protein [Candidatus Velthaea sp.]